MYTCVCIHIYIYIYTYICIYTCRYACMCVHTYIYMYMCMYIYIYVYMYMYIGVCVYIYIWGEPKMVIEDAQIVKILVGFMEPWRRIFCIPTVSVTRFPSFRTHSLTHSLTDAIPPGGGIGGAAHNQSVSVPARVPSGCIFGPRPWKFLALIVQNNGFLSNPDPGENLVSGSVFVLGGGSPGNCSRPLDSIVWDIVVAAWIYTWNYVWYAYNVHSVVIVYIL